MALSGEAKKEYNKKHYQLNKEKHKERKKKYYQDKKNTTMEEPKKVKKVIRVSISKIHDDKTQCNICGKFYKEVNIHKGLTHNIEKYEIIVKEGDDKIIVKNISNGNKYVAEEISSNEYSVYEYYDETQEKMIDIHINFETKKYEVYKWIKDNETANMTDRFTIKFE